MSYYKDFYIWLDETGRMDMDAEDANAEYERIEKLPKATLDKLHNEYGEYLGYTYQDGHVVPAESVGNLLQKAIIHAEQDVENMFTFDMESEHMFASNRLDDGQVVYTFSCGEVQISPSEKLCGHIAKVARDIDRGFSNGYHYTFEDYMGWDLYQVHIESRFYDDTRVERVRAVSKHQALVNALRKYHCDISIMVK